MSRNNGIDRIDLICADVQGAEGDLIDGGRQALARTRFFYTEFSDREWYERQVKLATITPKLPGFQLVEKLETDALLRNSSLATTSTPRTLRNTLTNIHDPVLDSHG